MKELLEKQEFTHLAFIGRGGGQGAEAALPTQEIWEEHSVIVLAAAALLFLGDPLATV